MIAVIGTVVGRRGNMKQLTAKILVMGEQGVGKTSLVGRYVTNAFDENVSTTIGASYFEISEEIGDYRIKLKLWDTAGQERFRSIMPMFYRNANAALLVYDVTSKESYKAIQHWVAELTQKADERILLFLIGNKTDISDQLRQIDQSQADTFAQSIGAHFREVSALSNHGVKEMFLDLCIKLVHRRQRESFQASTNEHSLFDVTQPIIIPQSEKRHFLCCG